MLNKAEKLNIEESPVELSPTLELGDCKFMIKFAEILSSFNCALNPKELIWNMPIQIKNRIFLRLKISSFLCFFRAYLNR